MFNRSEANRRENYKLLSRGKEESQLIHGSFSAWQPGVCKAFIFGWIWEEMHLRRTALSHRSLLPLPPLRGESVGVRGVVAPREIPTPLSPVPSPPKRPKRGKGEKSHLHSYNGIVCLFAAAQAICGDNLLGWRGWCYTMLQICINLLHR